MKLLSVATVFFSLSCLVACSSSSSPSSGGDGGAGPAAGAADLHCIGVTPIQVSAASCHPAAKVAPIDAGTAADDAGVSVEPEAPVLFNAAGDDDDCKYSVSFAVTPAVRRNENLTFTFTVKNKPNANPATGAVTDGVRIEAYLAANETHFRPNTTPATTSAETPAGSGVYTIAPVKFDAPGRWIVRLHFHEECSDEVEDSPHGHVAFYFDVP